MSLRVPLAFWHGTPSPTILDATWIPKSAATPGSEVSVLEGFSRSLDTRCLVVGGSEEGTCACWDVSFAEKKVIPWALFSGHSAPIAALCACVHCSKTAVCTVSLDGTICVWAEDGRCVALFPNLLQGSTTTVHAIPPNPHVVVCAGKHNDIDIVDLEAMRIVGSLRGHSDWVTSVSVASASVRFRFPDDAGVDSISATAGREEKTMVLSTSLDGSIRLWFLSSDLTSAEHCLAFGMDSGVPLCSDLFVADDGILFVEINRRLSDAKDPDATTDGDKVQTSCIEEGSVKIFALVVFETHAVVWNLQKNTPIACMLASDLTFDDEESDQQKKGGGTDSTGKPQHGGRYTTLYEKEKGIDSHQADKKQGFQFPTSEELGELGWVKGQFLQGSHGKSVMLVRENGAMVLYDLTACLDVSLESCVLRPQELEDKKFLNVVSGITTKLSISRVGANTMYGLLLDAIGVDRQHYKQWSSSTSMSEGGTSLRHSESAPAVVEDEAGGQQPDMFFALRGSFRKHLSKVDDHKLASSMERTSQEAMIMGISMQKILHSSTMPQVSGKKKMVTDHVAISEWSLYEIPDAVVVCEVTPSFEESAPDQSECNIASWVSLPHKGFLCIATDGRITMYRWDRRAHEMEMLAQSSFRKGWTNVEGISDDVCSNASIFRKGNRVFLHAKGTTSGKIRLWRVGPKYRDFHELSIGNGAPIRALYFLMQKNGPVFLVCGADDGSVHSWKMETLEKCSRWCKHAGSVLILGEPPQGIRERLSNMFFSIGEDRSIVLYNIATMECLHRFGAHSASILSISWRADSDYLNVRCNDGSVYIWELSTGLLERRVTGHVADDLVARFEALRDWESRNFHLGPSTADVNKQVMGRHGEIETTFIQPFDVPLPVSVMNINAKRIVSDIEKERKIDAAVIPLWFLFLWNWDDASIHEWQEQLGVPMRSDLAFSHVYYAVRGVTDSLTYFTPYVCEHNGPFGIHPVMSALHLLVIVGILQKLMTVPSLENSTSLLLTKYMVEMTPEKTPSFLWLAQFLRDTASDFQASARSMMLCILDRMTKEDRKKLIYGISPLILQTEASMKKQRRNAVIALALTATHVPEDVDRSTSGIVASGLTGLIEQRSDHQAIALCFLGSGFALWQYFIPDTRSLLRELFRLSLPLLTKRKIASSTAIIAKNSFDALLNVGHTDPGLFVRVFTEILEDATIHYSERAAGIQCVVTLAEKNSTLLLRFLPRVLESIIHVLDPSVPTVRKACLPSVTSALRAFVLRYPMVCFHRERQKIGVGGTNGVIVLLDLRSASKWQVVERAHERAITALCFKPSGDVLASYCAKENFIRTWAVDDSGVLNLISSSMKPLAEFPVAHGKDVSSVESQAWASRIRMKWYDEDDTIRIESELTSGVSFEVETSKKKRKKKKK
eukprot:TRINITY_DN11597_c0_g1_i1.p1 TRINITY_DN11597_c0_g1~~TRINITY_DN11597_c0_g1_i1.p1  ORF type:complete len:1410 (-),score=375.70 TRINITY_DN11597_c0_g1_i1:113-4342(-)